MQPPAPNQSVADKPRSPERLAWRFMLLLGAVIVVGEVVAIVAALSSDSDTGQFPFLTSVTNLFNPGGRTIWTDPAAETSSRFYRLKQLP